MQKEINSMLLHELKEFMQSNGIPGFRGAQLFTHFHKHQQQQLTEIKGFSKSLIDQLQALEPAVGTATIEESIASQNGETVKYGLRLGDGQMVEAVSMKYKTHNTLCLSTQVGCRMGCAFCASTKQGLARNITAGEITAQFYAVQQALGEPIQNIVLMGIGEPLDNYDEVIRGLQLLHDEQGRGLSYRYITLSTCGVVPGIKRLAQENIPINLAISLHASNDADRQKIMPIARRYSIQEVLDACDLYFDKTGRRVSYEYTVIPGVNNRPEDIANLVKLLKHRNAHMNLIAYHPIEEYKKEEPKKEELYQFQRALEKGGVHATVRRSIGLEEEGACGQLRARMKKERESNEN